MDPLKRLEKAIGYRFQNRSHLELALTHRSVSGSRNNERMEFLGDSVLSFVIAETLLDRFPAANEGDLSRLRAVLVRGETLSQIARQFDIGEYLRLGPGEMKSGGFRRDSILADALEAIIGAIHLDAGIEACKPIVLSWFADRLDNMVEATYQKDPKTRLQEFLQSRRRPLPVYEVLEMQTDAAAQHFTVVCKVDSAMSECVGQGQTRRAAEQNAAHAMLAALGLEVRNNV